MFRVTSCLAAKILLSKQIFWMFFLVLIYLVRQSLVVTYIGVTVSLVVMYIGVTGKHCDYTLMLFDFLLLVTLRFQAALINTTVDPIKLKRKRRKTSSPAATTSHIYPPKAASLLFLLR